MNPANDRNYLVSWGQIGPLEGGGGPPGPGSNPQVLGASQAASVVHSSSPMDNVLPQQAFKAVHEVSPMELTLHEVIPRR